MPKITPFLWFDEDAEEAAEFYTSVFENSKITSVSRYTEASAAAAGRKPGSVMTVAFELDGQRFVAINGGPQFTFTPATSFVIDCNDQKEVDHYWDKLTDGGSEEPCGWLRDRYGLSWQVVPSQAIKLIQDKDAASAERVMKALFQMKKIDIATLEDAYQS